MRLSRFLFASVSAVALMAAASSALASSAAGDTGLADCRGR